MCILSNIHAAYGPVKNKMRMHSRSTGRCTTRLYPEEIDTHVILHSGGARYSSLIGPF